jgi:hypothetical protein
LYELVANNYQTIYAVVAQKTAKYVEADGLNMVVIFVTYVSLCKSISCWL